MTLFVMYGFGQQAHAAGTICSGVSIGGVDVSGMTKEQAEAAVNQYVDSLAGVNISFIAGQGQRVSTSFADLGYSWANPDVVEQALSIITEGNVISRYKLMKDIEVNGASYDLQISFDQAAVEDFLVNQCKQYDIQVEDASLIRENGEFTIVGGNAGEEINIEASVEDIQNNLYTYYSEGTMEIPLIIDRVEPAGTVEQLSQVKDVLGTFTTSYSSSGSNRSANVTNGCSLINGTVLYPGEEFSAYQAVSPFTEANGYYLAGSYANGQVVESLGGGICQVSSTLYNAVLLAELDVTERNNHSMIVTYVQRSADAAISESSGKDFRFVNNTDYPIYIEGYTENKKITFTIYGVETRPSNRTVEYVSETLSETVPDSEKIITDAGASIGSISVQSAHIGYRAELWKVVYENGVEVSREKINSSNYAASPRTATVGVSTDNPDYYNRMLAAIGTGSIDTCQATAAQILAEASAAQAAAAAAAQAQLDAQAAQEAEPI